MTKNETGIRIIPPFIFIALLVVALIAQWLLPIRFFPEVISYTLGPVLLLISLLILIFVLLSFKKANTTFDVRRSASKLITDGPMRYSRNPTYVSLIILCIGIAITSNNIWILVMLPAAIYLLYDNVIRHEEKYLETLFGREYIEYKASVRRWL